MVSINVDGLTVTSLERRLRAFASNLSPAEQEALAGLLYGAAGAPPDNPASLSLRGVYVHRDSAGLIAPGPTPGGMEAIGPKQDDPRTPGGVEAIGPKQDDPRTPGGVEAIGPKQDDPRTPGGVEAIGPKQDDPRTSLNSKLLAFAATLTAAEAATFDWVMARADERPDLGGIPPEEGPWITNALRIGVSAAGANVGQAASDDFQAVLTLGPQSAALGAPGAPLSPARSSASSSVKTMYWLGLGAVAFLLVVVAILWLLR
jgi:hypothetical protein